jgi:hypothetical protein
MTKEQEVYLDDQMYLPIHYRGMLIEQPFYQGDGNHSVSELEALCRQFQNYCHQQAVIKEGCKRIIIELKFDKD